MEKKKIIIAGDTVPTFSNQHLFSHGFNRKNNFGPFSDEILYVFASADYSILNLETPLSNSGTPIGKSGPVLCAPEKCANGISSLGVKLCSLSNNHIMDYGFEGFDRTVKALAEQGIATTGAGENLRESKKGFVFELKTFGEKIRIGIHSFAEHEFSFATETSAGANPFDPFESFDQVRDLRKEVDFLIVLFHGGKEFHPYPSPLLAKTCRKFADCGADLVICQHSHCIGSRENYRGKEILYGQGNFIFDSPDSYLKSFNDKTNGKEDSVNLNNPWNSGLLVEVTLTIENKKIESSVNYIPVVKVQEKVRLADSTEKKTIMGSFERRSKKIQDPKFIEEEFKRFSKDKFSTYVSTFLGKRGKSFLYRALNKITGQKLRKNNYSKEELLELQNCFQCESHREVILTALKPE